MSTGSESDGPLVVVGASLAGMRAVEAARRLGYAGEIVLIGKEDHLPYDRPPLSKAQLELGGAPDGPKHYREEAHLRDELDVQLRLGRSAVSLDTASREVQTSDGAVLRYGALVIATGARPRSLPFAANRESEGLVGFRTYADSRVVRDALTARKRIAVVGAGLIGSEVASSARTWKAEVTLVEAQPAPLVRALGSEVGCAVASLHEANGVRLILGAAVESLMASSGAVTGLSLRDGATVPADLVVSAVGVAPEVEWLADSGLRLGDGVECDEMLWTGAPGVYAAGDVVSWPNGAAGRQRLENWTAAAEQGAAAVRNALNPSSPTPYVTTPYFWSDWYGNRLQFVGSSEADEVVWVEGPAEHQCRAVALYRRGDVCVGAFLLNAPAETMKHRAQIGHDVAWRDAVEFAAGRAVGYAERALAQQT